MPGVPDGRRLDPFTLCSLGPIRKGKTAGVASLCVGIRGTGATEIVRHGTDRRRQECQHIAAAFVGARLPPGLTSLAFGGTPGPAGRGIPADRDILLANFPTHIAVSSALGAAYGSAAHVYFGVDTSTCALAGGLCALGGMLPDLDSDNSRPVREILSFSAAAIPMLLVDRFRALSLSAEEMVLAGAAIYALVRFGFGTIFKRFTVHRGMFHSIPAMGIAFLATFLLCQGDDAVRVFKAAAVALGFLSHLILDEIWAVQWTWTGPRFKKSFGTAIKMFGDKLGPNAAAYGVLLILGLLSLQSLGVASFLSPAPAAPETFVDRLSSGHPDIRR